jgi:hypothetical protein
MARRLIACSVLLCLSLVASCSDATAPGEAFLVVVAQDTVHLYQGGTPPFITFRERFVSPARNKVWVIYPDLETEVSPGKWQLLFSPDTLYLQALLGNATAPSNADLAAPRTMTFYVPAGRYRLLQRYQVTRSDAVKPAGEVFLAASNEFVVVP